MNEIGLPTFSLLEQSASTAASHTDTLFVAMLVICGLMGVVLAVLVVWFSIRYRAGAQVDRSHPPSHANGLEAAWTAVPLALFLGIFVWAASDSIEARRVPANALPIYVVGKQWMWKVQHGDGRREINELHVPIDQPVVLVLASQDVIHDFYVPAFRLKQDVVPGRYTHLAFTANRLGDFRVLCSEYCGTEHSAMLGHVVVMTQADYARWDRQKTPASEDGPAPQQLGAALYRRLACASCHGADSSVHAPPLEGLYGRRVTVEGGTTLVADDNYLRESIVAPKRHVVQGQAPLMPSYAGQLSEEELQDLVAYLRALPPVKEKP
jgi:cytochrome c oxidase subunit 2